MSGGATDLGEERPGLGSFGRLGDGREIREAVLVSEDGLEARIIGWGAVLRDLRVPAPGGARSVVLGYDRLDPYLDQPGYLGAVVGRYANRVADARFALDGREVRLLANEGRHALHGGPVGFARRPWSFVSRDATGAHLALVSEDGDQGYPGRLVAFASYEVRAPLTLRITLQAFADRPTPVNLTTHSYYNLDGSPDVREHLLTVAADRYTPVDSELIPTGELLPVEGAPFDFRKPRALGEGAPRPGFDINLVLAGPVGEAELAWAATLASPRSGLAMELWTSEPGLQVYDGHQLDQLSAPGRGGVHYRPFAGVALEPQRFPDGPNHPQFPPAIIRPGTVSRQVTELRFRLRD